MTIPELLADLRRRGITVGCDGDRLRVSAPKGVLTADLQAQVSARKRELLDWLRRATEAQATWPPIVAVARDGALKVSFAQQRLWFLQQMDPGSSAYTIASSIRLPPDADERIIQRAVAEVVRRHESLRTAFGVQDGEPVPIVCPPGRVDVPVHDLRDAEEDAQRSEAERLWSQEARHAFDLSAAPPVRFAILRRTAETSLLVTQHHIITDRWSLGLLMRDLLATYEALASGGALPPEPSIQYIDYAQWQRGLEATPRYREHLDYWKRQLRAPLAVIDLPLDRPRPPVQTYEGTWETKVFSSVLREAVHAFAQREGVTPFMLLLAAFAALLSRYSGQTDIVMGSPIAGRTDPVTETILGCFVNTLALRIDVSGAPSFRELLRRTRDVALDAYAHQHTPFEHLVAELHPERDLSRSPIFQVAFNFQNAPQSVDVTSEMSITTSGSSMFDLSLTLNEALAGLQGTFEYNVALFDRGTIARLLQHYERLLAVAITFPDAAIPFLPLLADDERIEMLDQWNRTAASYPGDARLQDLIERSAAATPDAIAVESDGEALTYRELVAAANRVASRLRRAGVVRGDRVGVCVDRHCRMVPALLGVLHAGAAYVPLDPALPRERLAYMLDDAGVRLVLTDRKAEASLPSPGPRRMYLDRDAPMWSGVSVFERTAGSSSDPAYVIYTSGSTGRPKGVQVPHRAVVNFLASMAVRPGLSSADVLVTVTTLSFDIAGLELFLPLTVGARVVVASRDEATDGRRLLGVLQSARATVMQATPATWRLLIEAGWQGSPALRMFCGGEALPSDLARDLLQRSDVLWNLYGPTETTIWSSVDRVVDGGSITIGRPIANTKMYVLDEAGQLVPPGVTGELYIGGDGLAHGYLHRPELTAEKFVPDPFCGRHGARMYRTGDVAKFRRDGRIVCLGRVDYQVKVRGFRLELGEIEAALVAHESIAEAVVVTQPDGSGESRLVAFFVAAPGAAPTASDLRTHLRTRLPDYMVPSFFLELGALPRTQNGKVDRKALPQALASATPRDRTVPPRTATERTIAAIWSAVLGVEGIGVHDNFFDVGGHSLASMKVIARIGAALGVGLGPRDMLLDTLEQIAATCDARMRAVATPASAGVS